MPGAAVGMEEGVVNRDGLDEAIDHASPFILMDRVPKMFLEYSPIPKGGLSGNHMIHVHNVNSEIIWHMPAG